MAEISSMERDADLDGVEISLEQRPLVSWVFLVHLLIFASIGLGALIGVPIFGVWIFPAIIMFHIGLLWKRRAAGPAAGRAAGAEHGAADPADEPDEQKRAGMERALSYMGLEPGTKMEEIKIDKVATAVHRHTTWDLWAPTVPTTRQ